MKKFLYLPLLFLVFHSKSSITAEYSFDASLLGPSDNQVDISVFNNGGQLPGTYIVDILLNNNYVATEELSFHNILDKNGKPVLTPCLSMKQLSAYGVLTEDYPEIEKGEDKNCIEFDGIPGLIAAVNVAVQELNITVPQIAVRKSITGIAPEAMWDDGINALRINYDLDASHTLNKDSSNRSSDNVWLLLQPGINIGAWRLRNQSSMTKNSSTTTKWQTLSSYADRDIRALKSRLSIGERTVAGEIFDSFNVKGVMLSTNDSMMPYHFREYGPVIRGIAEKPLRITVSQNGNIIYSGTMPPGPFVIDDLSVVGQTGELLVTSEEPDGSRRQYTVVWQSPAIAVREKYFRYDALIGKYIHSSMDEEPTTGQLTAIYGLPYNMTVYGGIRATANYKSWLSGIGKSLGNLGSISVDLTSTLHQDTYRDRKGNAWRLRYSSIFNDSKTSLYFTSYYAHSPSYRTLDTALSNGCYSAETKCNTNTSRYRYDLNLRQEVYDGWNVFATYSVQNNHNGTQSKSSGAGISTLVPWIGYLSADYVENSNYSNKADRYTDRVASISLSIPFGSIYKQNLYSSLRMTSSRSNSQQNYSLNGSSLNQEFHWGINHNRAVDNTGTTESNYANVMMINKYSDIDASVSKSETWQQYGMGIRGGLLMHKDGVTVGKYLGETIALVDAQGAQYAAVDSYPGVYTNSSGFGLVPGVSPYQINNVQIDPASLEENDDIYITSQKTAPSSGAVVKVTFLNYSGNKILVKLKTPTGKAISLGAIASLESEKPITGIVDENSQVYMSGMPDKGRIKISTAKEKCSLDYEIKKSKDNAGLYSFEAICK
ncbi:putative F1 capsule anchoring protein [Yersinia intermedia]|uniref:fimbria/pilus outer membrane usher protein n=1 Tax=Yersinia intermedia TaxID=631 RepID=UPI0005E462B9|nr:fimbria/pilus outer membrane usher protein [Yersinia intermedia]CND04603.1 putative F1 capsule anchoring protein [Yersinia intermedia]CNH38289.1 putative F1 capsule anchoring protein [Yersinia intermedia]